jgi:hypothetical protein
VNNFAELDAKHEEKLEKASYQKGIDGEFSRAVLLAFRGSKADGLVATRGPNGDLQYTQEQGAAAACQGREDAAATLIIQRDVLRRLATLQTTAWSCLAVLIYIAFRVS